MVATIAALVLLLGSIAAAFLMSHRWGWSSSGRRPHLRHGITRVICTLIGLAVLVVMTVCTVAEARQGYRERPEVAFRIPTLPAPEPPKRPGPVEKGRYLVYVALANKLEGALVPVHARSIEVRWPEDRGRSFAESVRYGSTTVSYSFEIDDLRFEGSPNDLSLYPSGRRSMQARGWTHSSMSTGGLTIPFGNDLYPLGESSEALSITPNAVGGGAFLMDLRPVREDDPLRNGTLEEFINLRGEAAWGRVFWTGGGMVRSWAQGDFPAAALAGGLGGALLLLLLAALALAQLFRRRSLGFVKVAACLLLYVGALDRAVLRLHEARARDGSEKVENRIVACAHLTSTMFFRRTAQQDLEALAADPTAPIALRNMAGRIAYR